MSLFVQKLDSNTRLLCRSCLSPDRKLFNIHKYNLKAPYEQFLGCVIYPMDSCPYLCFICASVLLKCVAFKFQCESAQKMISNTQPTNLSPTLHFLNILTLTKTEVNITQSNIIEHDNTPFKDEETTDNELNSELFVNNKPVFDAIKCDHTVNNEIETLKSECNDLDIQFEIDCKTKTKRKKRTEHKIRHVTIVGTKKGKFETKENIANFEKAYDVDIVILSREQQMNEVLERKKSLNYISGPKRCEDCFKGFIDDENLKKHCSAQHDPSRGNIVCEFCHFRYRDKKGLNQHLKSHRLKFICRQCKYISRTTFNAKEHFKTHTGQIYKCQYCDKTYEQLSSHLSHVRIHHPSEEFWCDLCGISFIGQFGLNIHKRLSHRDMYKQASTDMSQSIKLREQIQREAEKLHQCEKCNKTFAKKCLYSAHYRRAHTERALSRPRLWVCEWCGKSLPNRCLLVYHQRNHTGEKPYSCTQCNKGFTMKKLLQSHMRVHTADRPYVCKTCSKSFKGLSALRAHEHNHSDEKINTKRLK